jgi:hypothetical protein
MARSTGAIWAEEFVDHAAVFRLFDFFRDK